MGGHGIACSEPNTAGFDSLTAHPCGANAYIFAAAGSPAKVPIQSDIFFYHLG